MPDYQVIPNPTAFHPFALIAASDDLIFVTGTAVPGATAAEQARRALEEIRDLLERVGSSLAEIVYFRPLVTRSEYGPEINEVIDEMLPDPKPACAALIVCELAAPELMVEFEAIAQRGARLVVSSEAP